MNVVEVGCFVVTFLNGKVLKATKRIQYIHSPCKLSAAQIELRNGEKERKGDREKENCFESRGL